jgi:hypothetical protein
MAINPLTMISGKKNGFVASDPALWQQVKILLEEGIAAARCRGVRLDYNEMLQHIHNICILTADGTSSMLQDRIFCRKTEIDHINGIRDDNRAENLRWCTPEENTHLAWETKITCLSRRSFKKKVMQNQWFCGRMKYIMVCKEAIKYAAI